MNVIKVLTKEYEKKSNWAICENEPKTNPILSRRSLWRSRKQSQFQRQKMLLRLKIEIGMQNAGLGTVLALKHFGGKSIIRRGYMKVRSDMLSSDVQVFDLLQS